MGNSFNSEYQEFDHSNPGFTRLEPLKFHELHSAGVVVSPNRLVLRCLDQGSGMAFSDRPIQPEEIICLKVVMFHKGVFRFGLTTYDPANLSQESLGIFLARSSKSIFLKDVSSGTTQKNTLIFFKLTQDGQVVYGWQRKDKEKDKGVLISDVPVHIPVWAIFHISGRNLALKLEGDTLQVLRAKSFRNKQTMIRTKSLEVLSLADSTRDISPSSNVDPEVQSTHQEERTTNFSRSRSFSISGPSQRRASQSSTTPDLQTSQNLTEPGRQHGRRFSKPQPKQMEERIPMCFHLKAGRNISLSAERTMATNRTGQSNGYVFTRRPLWTEEKLVILISKVNVESGANLGFGLTVCDPKAVVEFPDDADELLDREEYWVFVKDACTNLVEGDVLAFMINKRGEVGMSKNQSPFRTLMHVDPLMLFWAFFDVTGPLEKISSLGTVLHRKQSSGCLIDTSADIPRSEVPRPMPTQPSAAARSNEKYEMPSQATIVQNNLVTSRESQVIPPQVRNSFHHLDLFSDFPPMLAPPLIPVPSDVRPQIPQRKSKAPREIRKPSVATPSPVTEPQNPETAKRLNPKEIESLLKVDFIKTSKEEQKPMEALPHECSICLENEPDCVLYTCGHMCLCFECGQGILKGSNPLCPLCRKPVADIIKIYKS